MKKVIFRFKWSDPDRIRDEIKRRRKVVSMGYKTPCWLWLKSSDANGYGQMTIQYKSVKAHRLSYMMFVGPIAKGLLVCHHCDNGMCIRPDHLFLGTDLDNRMDCIAKGRFNPNKGESNGRAKLKEENVRFIREERGKRPRLKIRELAAMFKISPTIIKGVARRTMWKHVA